MDSQNQPAAVLNFQTYQSMTQKQLLSQLTLVASELANAHIIYASTLQQEKSARVRGFATSGESSVSGRERDAEAQALPLTLGLYEMQGQIRALQEEKELLLLLVGIQNDTKRDTMDNPSGLSTGD